MAEEKLLKLFEQNWSEKPIFKKHKDSCKVQEEEIQEEEEVKSNGVERAMSDTTMMTTTSSKTSLFGSSSDDLFLSPRSVLPKLQTILSGKEVNEFTNLERQRVVNQEQRKQSRTRTRTRRGKSMSDLEYEELKGFMDLGFVFSEEDHKDSDLVSILPGLVKKHEEEEKERRARGPYLSEVWDHCGGRKGKKKMMITPEIKWRALAPAMTNEVDLKDHLKLWAHAVASTIRS